MEFFNKAKAVRLRSHHHKFLVADEDEAAVCQSHNGSTPRARWTVEFLPHDTHHIRLKSCYGIYLTASDEPYLLGTAGRKVLLQDMSASEKVDWEPLIEGSYVKLQTRHGEFLRANRGMPPWRNSVTHGVPHRSVSQDWVLWEVDMVEIIESE